IDIGTNSDPVLMMPGISKALITTAAGMLIAVPAVFAHRYFQRLVQEYVAELEQQATLFHASLFYRHASDVKEHIKKAGQEQAMKFKRNQVEDVHINLTPMIDCLLFILVFLLLSTTFNQMSRMNLTLPDAQGVPPKNFDQKIEVIVDANGHYAVNGQSIASK